MSVKEVPKKEKVIDLDIEEFDANLVKDSVDLISRLFDCFLREFSDEDFSYIGRHEMECEKYDYIWKLLKAEEAKLPERYRRKLPPKLTMVGERKITEKSS